MKRFSYIFMLAIFALAACTDGDTDLNQLIADYDAALGNDITPMAISIDETDISEEIEVVPTEDDDPTYYNDYIENSSFTKEVTIVFDGDKATVKGTVAGVNVVIDGAHVTVNSTASSVVYNLTGTSSDGSFKIYSDNRFCIFAYGLNLTSSRGAAINSQSGKTMYFITGVNGCTLRDAQTYAATPSLEDEKATLFSEGQIVFSGMGKLNVTSQAHHAIASDDYIRFRVGTNTRLLSYAGHGVKANDGVFINGGVLNIEVLGDGSKGINSEDDVIVSGGRTTIITDGATRIAGVDTTSVAALKCDSTVTINGGELRFLTRGNGSKGINVNGNLNLTDGKLYIVNLGVNDTSKAKGIKLDGNLTMTSGHLYVFSEARYTLDVRGSTTFANGYTSRTNYLRLFELVY